MRKEIERKFLQSLKFEFKINAEILVILLFSYLKHVISLKEEEEKTMTRFKDWIPGTLFGMPLYQMVHEEQHFPLRLDDYTLFRPQRERTRFTLPTMLSMTGG